MKKGACEMDYILKFGKGFRKSAKENKISNERIKVLIKEIKYRVVHDLAKREKEFLFCFENKQQLYGLHVEIEYS